jgi:hypothetical protein
MASILDRYRTNQPEKKRSSILNRYREQPEYGYSQADRSSEVVYRPEEVKVETNVPKTQKQINEELPWRDIPVIGKVLKGLDWVSETPVQNTIADIGETLYTPGAGLANVASFAGGVGSKLAQVAPKLTNTFGGRVATEAIKEGAVGVPLGMGQALTQGQDLDEVLKQGALGGVLGAVGGAGLSAIAPKVTSILKRYSKSSQTEPIVATKQPDIEGLKSRIDLNKNQLAKTDRAIENVNKAIMENGLTDNLKVRMQGLSKERAGINAQLNNREAKLFKMDSPQEVSGSLKNTAEQLDSFDPLDVKDLGGFSAQTRDIYRNLEATMGPNARPYIEGFDLAKKDNIEMQEYWLNRMKTEVVDKLGIKKGSKESAAVQWFGEKKKVVGSEKLIDVNTGKTVNSQKTVDYTLDDLKKDFPNKWEDIVKADKWFRESYDNLIDIVNESRLKIYPNNPEKIVPKRNDYYRHFKDMEGIAGLKNLFETPSQISPGLSGLSEFVKPNSKFAGFMQKRGLGSFRDDAVGGFLDYIPSASYSTKIDPQIEVFRSLAKALADVTDETRNVNGLIEYLQDYANGLAGKTNPADRWVQKLVGRRTMGVVRWINNRVKTNTILGNAGSLLAQLGNVPNGIAATKQHALKGAGETMASIVNRKDALVNQSPFLKERYFNTREFDTRWFEQPKKLASWAIETADRIGTEFMWNSAVAQGRAKNVADPIAYADDLTRKLVAGRGVGEQPLIQGSTTYQVLAPFTLEVMNAWRVMGDFVKKKDITAIATLFVGSYMFNKIAEEVRGSGVVFDPIDAMVDATEEGLSPIERGGRLVGEVLSNVPLGDKIAGLYPEYGENFLGLEKVFGDLPTREMVFGENDPTRFGGGLTVSKGIQDPVYKLIPPLGGGQIKKTMEGVRSLVNGGYEKDGKLRFPIERTPTEIGKAIAFGPNATSAGQDYYDNERRPLSEGQTEAYDLLPKDQRDQAYVELMRSRLEDNAKRVMKDEKLTEKEKNQKIKALQKKFDELKD